MACAVLLIEDEADNRHVIEFALSRDLRFEVSACAYGAEGVQLAEQLETPFDVVLLDYLLPDIAAEECMTKLRAASRTREAKIILVTAHIPLGGIAAYAAAEQVDGVIIKPFDVIALGDTISAIVAVNGTSSGGSLNGGCAG